MIELRLANKNDTEQQKNIWKLCFGDPDSFIELYFSDRYKADETALLLHNGHIASMLAMLPANVVNSGGERHNAAILYAIATHPKYQGRGYAGRLIEFSNGLLAGKNIQISILTPAGESLYQYYQRLGFKTGFYLNETVLSSAELLTDTKKPSRGGFIVYSVKAHDYNRRREMLLAGKPYLSYNDEEIAYQKMLSIKSGADIYALDCENVQGCAAVERINSDTVLVKEILLPPGYISDGINQVAGLLPAKSYILRMPVFLGHHYGGKTRPFAMYKETRQCNTLISSEAELYYLGFAFD